MPMSVCGSEWLPEQNQTREELWEQVTGHNYIGHNDTGRKYIFRNYIHHNCIGHSYAGHGYTGHNYTGHSYIDHDYIEELWEQVICLLRLYGYACRRTYRRAPRHLFWADGATMPSGEALVETGQKECWLKECWLKECWLKECWLLVFASVLDMPSPMPI